MKIRNYNISKKTVKKSIAAMRLLIKMYQDEYEWGRLCPLCEINFFNNCSGKPCPWYVMTNATCTMFAAICSDETLKRSRIRQLLYWISVYEKVLKENQC